MSKYYDILRILTKYFPKTDLNSIWNMFIVFQLCVVLWKQKFSHKKYLIKNAYPQEVTKKITPCSWYHWPWGIQLDYILGVSLWFLVIFGGLLLNFVEFFLDILCHFVLFLGIYSGTQDWFWPRALVGELFLWFKCNFGHFFAN